METPRTTLLPHRSEHGSWLLALAEPAPHLRGFVHRYEGYQEEATRFERHLQTPASKVPLIINLGPPFRISGPRGGDQVIHSFVAGLHDIPVLVGADGPQHCVQVDLTPLGARRIFGLPMRELSNQVVELDALLGRPAALLIERLYDAPGWDERFAILDAVLTARIERAPAVRPEIAWAWRQIDRNNGREGVGALAEELGWSHKHLIAQFREHVGLPPKKLARILRFEQALDRMFDCESVCLASIAQAAGYFDQAHLHRDFRQFAGITPAEFLRRRLPGMTGLVGD